MCGKRGSACSAFTSPAPGPRASFAPRLRGDSTARYTCTGRSTSHTSAEDIARVIGMFPTFHLIEYAEGFELPDELHAHPAVVELKRLASRLVGMGNDLGGLAKDIRNRWLNLVLVD